MIEKKAVYCEMAFLNEFLNSYPSLEPNEESLKLVDAWMSFYLFFCKSDIVLDISVSEFNTLAKSNSWLFRLWKKSSEGQCGLEFEKETFPDVSKIVGGETDSRILNAVYLTTKENDECNRRSQEIGVFVLNPEMARHCNHLFCDNGSAFPDERTKDWSFIKGLLSPSVIPPINISNSMLIIDNYILYDDWDIDYQQKMDYNLKPILQNILPTRIAEGVIYEIVVFVGIRSEDVNKKDFFGASYHYLRALIERIRKDLKFRLSVFIGKSEDKFHDRSIVTNNVLINSGHGFGILRKGGKTNSPTSINIVFPFFQTKMAWCDRSFLNIMQTARRIIERYHEHNVDCWGDYKEGSRLISYYNSTESKKNQQDNLHVYYQVPDKDVKSGLKIIGKMDISLLDHNRRRSF